MTMNLNHSKQSFILRNVVLKHFINEMHQMCNIPMGTVGLRILQAV